MWTGKNLMKFNTDKSKYMIINFTDNHQFNTKLSLEKNVLEQVSEQSLLDEVIYDRLTWDSNTDFIVKKA